MLITRLSIPDHVGNEWPFTLPGVGDLAPGVEQRAARHVVHRLGGCELAMPGAAGAANGACWVTAPRGTRGGRWRGRLRSGLSQPARRVGVEVQEAPGRGLDRTGRVIAQ